jgi:hypothetical protein
MTEDRNDIENVEAWAVVIEGMLARVPPELRAEILALAMKNEAAEIEEGNTNPLRIIDLSDDDLVGLSDNTPGLRHWNVVMRLKALLVQMFVRSIVNNHSPETAAALLFGHHQFGTGSGVLQDYLDAWGCFK